MHLLNNFKELTVRPKNARELKGLILQLAIQGKLTANWRKENPDVEPASALLKRIQKEKEKLIKEKKIKKDKPLPPITKEDIPYELPEGWVGCRVGDLTTIKGGKRIPKGYQLSDTKTDHVYIRVTDMKNGSVIFNKLKYITDDVFEKIKAYTISKDDLYITIAGTIGDVGEIPEELDNMNLTENAAKILIYQINKSFLKSLLNSHICQSQFLDKVNQMAQPKLALHRIASTIIPLPPLEEQKRIVEIVKALFKDVEQLEQLTVKRISLKEKFVASALNQLTTNNTKKEWAFLQVHFPDFFNETANIKKLRETVLQLAVQGKLTADWRASNPDIEDASSSLKRIQKNKAQLIKDKKIKKDKPLPPITKDEIPYKLPEGWVWCRMSDLIRFMAYGTSQKTNDNSDTIPVLRMGNLSSEGKLHFNNLKYIPADHKDLPNLYLNFGDLVFNRTNSYELVGKSAVYKGKGHKYTLASYLIKVSLFIEEVNFDYVNNYIISNTCRKTQIEPQITAQTNQANFSGSKLRNICVPLPSKGEQKAIVQKVNSLMGLCDVLEQEVQQSKEQSEQLMQSVLKEVFERKERLTLNAIV